MKKIRMMMALMLFAMIARADNQYLVFQTQDGTETSVTTENLVITFGDGMLLTNKELSFDVADLNKMFFMKSTGISDVLSDEADGEVTAFLPSGIECGTFHNVNIARAMLRPGVYILKSKSKSVKVIVR